MMLLDVLTIEQARAAYRFGLDRAAAARAAGRRHRYGYNPDPVEEARTHAESAVAEHFIAAAIDEPLRSNALEPDDGVDVGDDVCVRWTPLEHGCLVIHETDADRLRGALVVGRSPLQRFVGMHPVAESKRAEYWRTDVRFPAFFVPQRVIEPWIVI